MEWAKISLALVLYPVLTIVLSRLLLILFPWRRSHPAQGTFTLAALAALAGVLSVMVLFSGSPLFDESWLLLYLTGLLGAAALVMISVLCVSESGRRFYLLHLIEGGIRSLPQLRERYNHDHMLETRLERLLKWRVLEDRGGRYWLVRWSAYWYSQFFRLWGRLLGFHWK